MSLSSSKQAFLKFSMRLVISESCKADRSELRISDPLAYWTPGTPNRNNRGNSLANRKSLELNEGKLRVLGEFDNLLFAKDADKRTPRMLANVGRLSRMLRRVLFHSAPGLAVGRTSSLPKMPICSKAHWKGLLGMGRTSAPRGMHKNPTVSDIPHSRLPKAVTWKAVPPTKTMRAWTPSSASNY